MAIVENKFIDKSDLESQLCADIAGALQQSLLLNGKASLAVSGGSTPKALFALLSQQPLDWKNVTVTLVDERWVENDHADSNEKLVRDNLLVGEASKANFQSLKLDFEHPEQAMPALESQLNEIGELTVAVLGMGGDAHTASFFPKAPTLSQALDMDSGKKCQWTDPKTAPHLRMTLTLPYLLNAQLLSLHITGEEKLDVFEEALTADDISDAPIGAVIQQEQKDVALYWAP